MSESLYCGLAFGSVSIGVEGDLKPCCGIVPDNFLNTIKLDDHISVKINDDKLREVRRDLINGVWPKACLNCKNAEDAGVSSMRQVYNKTIPDAPLTIDMNPNSVKFLDISMGNKCNSKCMTCNPMSSDFWIDEYKFVTGSIPIQNTYSHFSKKLAHELADTFTNIEGINFIGGEPLFIDEHIDFLNFLIEKNLSNKINIGYVTNLTIINDALIDIWSQFKSVGASISIDGYGIVNDYIRYPIKFNKVDTNLKSYIDLISQDKFGMTLSSTISVFNINHFADLLDYIVDLIVKQKESKGLSNHKTAVFFNRVTSPDYFNLNILSNEYRSIGLEKIQKVKEKIKNYDIHHSFISNCDLIEAWCREPQVVKPELYKQALDFIHKSDEYRKRNIVDYIPDVYNELVKLDKLYNG